MTKRAEDYDKQEADELAGQKENDAGSDEAVDTEGQPQAHVNSKKSSYSNEINAMVDYLLELAWPACPPSPPPSTPPSPARSDATEELSAADYEQLCYPNGRNASSTVATVESTSGGKCQVTGTADGPHLGTFVAVYGAVLKQHLPLRPVPSSNQ